MSSKNILLICIFFFGSTHQIHTGTVTLKGGEQCVEAIAGAVVGTAIVSYSAVKLGYDSLVGCVKWISKKGEERRLRKEEQNRLKREDDRQLIEAKVREEVHLARLAQQQAHQERVAPLLDKHVNELLDSLPNDIQSAISDDNLFVTQDVLNKRYEALCQFEQGTATWYEQKYPLNSNARVLLEEQNINQETYSAFYGIQIQHVLHQEYVNIIHAAADLPAKYPHNKSECQNISATVALFAHAGQQHNHAGALKQSFLCADFCYGMLYVGEQIITINYDIGKAVGTGVLNGCANIAYNCAHPYETFKGSVKGFGQLIVLTARITDYVEATLTEHAYKRRHKLRQDEQDIQSGKYTKQYIFQRDEALADQYRKETIKQVGDCLTAAWKRIDYESSLIALEKGSETITEVLLPASALKALSALVGNGARSLNTLAESGALWDNFNSVPCNGNTVHAAISYQAAIAQEAARAMELAGVVTADVLDGASKITPTLSALNGAQGPLGEIPGDLPNPPMDIIDAMQSLSEADRIEMSKYVGLKEHNGYPIIPPFEHTWVATVTKNGKITGFHQDRGGFYRRLGYIKDIRMFEGGFYRAKVYFKGKWVERSFFPEDWCIGELMSCYYEAVDSKNIRIITELRTTFELERPGGVIVRVVLENTGAGITFFPKLLI